LRAFALSAEFSRPRFQRSADDVPALLANAIVWRLLDAGAIIERRRLANCGVD
jgi:hypothetical protein